MRLAFLLLLCGLGPMFVSGQYYLMSGSKYFTPGEAYKFHVATLNTAMKSVVEFMVKPPGVAAEQLVMPALSEVTSVPGTTDEVILNIPAVLTEGSYFIRLTGRDVGTNRQLFVVDHGIAKRTKMTSVFIQTDKAMYKPGSTVNFRVFPVLADLKPVMSPRFTIEIYDGKKNRIKQWVNATGENSFSSVFINSLTLSTPTILGDWKIKATAGVGAQMETEEKVFTVKEYVLPRFSVEVVVADYAVISPANKNAANYDLTISGQVISKYTYGKDVTGQFTLYVAATRNGIHPVYKRQAGKEPVGIAIDVLPGPDIRPGPGRSNSPLELDTMSITGTEDFSFTLTKAQLESLGCYNAECQLLVIANLTETLSKELVSENSTIQIYPSEQSIKFMNSDKIIRPGMMFKTKLVVTSRDGTAAPPATVFYEFRISKSCWSYPCNQDPTETVQVALPVSGIINIEIPLPVNSSSIYLEAWYRSKTTGPRTTLNVNSVYQSDIKQSLQIKVLSDGQNAPGLARFTASSTVYVDSVVVSVVTRGVLQTSYSNTVGLPGKVSQIELPTRPEYGPTSTLIVYYVSDGEVIADSIDFNVGGFFNRNPVDIAFSESRTSVTTQSTLTVTAKPSSFVAVRVVDQSVLLMQQNNDINKDHIIDKLSDFDTSSSTREPMNAYQVFTQSGQFIESDAVVSQKTSSGNEENRWLAGMPQEEVGQPVAPQEDNADAGGTSSGTSDTAVVARTYFPETWIWATGLVGLDGTFSLTETVPDTITSWTADGFALHPIHGLGVTNANAELFVFKVFFASLNLPYKIKQDEQLKFDAIIFNYLESGQAATATVTLAASNDFLVKESDNEIGSSRAITKTVTIPHDTGVAVPFILIAKNFGNILIDVTARAGVAADRVKRTLIVKPAGRQVTKNEAVFVKLDEIPSGRFAKTVTADFPPANDANLVAGTKQLYVTVIADVMGPALDGLDNLIQMPRGCGEQNMITLTPNIYVRQYLKSSNDLSQDAKDLTNKYMEQGYQRELQYKHDSDGSFSAFGDSDSSGSTWLTAFVCRSFSQAKTYIPETIEDAVLARALMFIIDNQNPNGTFNEPGRVIHSDMQGNAASGDSLTAYILMALLENNDLNFMIPDYAAAVQRTKTYLESAIATSTDLYFNAITCFALALADSPSVTTCLTKLESWQTTDGGMVYWEPAKAENTGTDSDRRHFYRPANLGVEITAYVLLTYMESGGATNAAKALKLMKWLLTQRNARGGFGSTQNTVVGLEALAVIALEMSKATTSASVDLTIDGVQYTKNVDTTNARVLQAITSKDVTDPNVEIVVSGDGMILVQVESRYYTTAPKEAENIGFTLEANYNENNSTVHINSCTWVKTAQPDMVVTEIELQSGFRCGSPSDLTYPEQVKRVEIKGGDTVVIYHDALPVDQHVCVGVTARRVDEVSNLQPATAKTYMYYDADVEISRTYNIVVEVARETTYTPGPPKPPVTKPTVYSSASPTFRPLNAGLLLAIVAAVIFRFVKF